MNKMRFISMFIVLCGISSGSGAENEDPIVHIPGRDEVERPTRTTVLSPPIIKIDTVEAGAPAEVPPPKAIPISPGIPIGGVIAWTKSMTNTPALPAGWVECNGQELSDLKCPYHGMIIPNLNGAGGKPQRFLRGNTETGATGGSPTHGHGGVRSQKYGNQRKPVAATIQASNIPPFYEVTWIMRVR